MRDQVFLLPADMREWLPEDHPVWLVITVVEEHLDTSAFHAARKTGGAGTAGYDPDMLLTVLIWAYAHKVTSSRRMEQLCRTDVAFRVICGGSLPDHSTLARFRAGFAGAVAGLFAEVLALCARLGMGKLGTVALDGMKITANASKPANRTEDGLVKLAREMVAAHARADAGDDDLYGDGRGDEVPEDAWSPRRRDERIAAALAGLRAEREAADREEAAKAAQFRARREAGQRTGPAPRAAAVELAEENLARQRAAQQAKCDAWEQDNAAAAAATGTGLAARTRPQAPDRYCRVRQAAAKLAAAQARAADAEQDAARKKEKLPSRNMTDPDSRLMPARGGGFTQGYNTQNVTSEDELIIATELTADPTDMAWFGPMMEQAEQAAALIGANRPASPDSGSSVPGPGPGGIGQALADAGYCSQANLTCDGPDRLIATGKRRDLGKAAPDSPDQDRGGPAVQAMRERLRTQEGITAYRRRGHIAETPHGHIKHNLGFRQLSMRGKPKAAAEWTFTCTVYNLLKALSTGHLTSQALTSLPG